MPYQDWDAQRSVRIKIKNRRTIPVRRFFFGFYAGRKRDFLKCRLGHLKSMAVKGPSGLSERF